MSTNAPTPSGHDGMETPGEGRDEFAMSSSNALIPLLILFAATILAVLIVIVRAKPVIPHEGVAADQAFGPADFPMVFGSEAAIPGLGADSPVVSRGAAASSVQFPVPAPPFSEGIFPCSQCHADLEVDPTRRPLEGMHSDIEFHHDAENRWCLDCHDAGNRDQLRLASGAPVPFTESYRLCGQCHGTQYRDWRSGIHGKRTGYWDGSKRYLLCVNCHNPHHPRFADLKPLPPPVRPQFARHDAARPANASPAQEETRDAVGPH